MGNALKIKTETIIKRKFADAIKPQDAHIEALQARLAALEEQVKACAAKERSDMLALSREVKIYSKQLDDGKQ